ncbi:hypothetical protein A3F66_02640 [candidate division TM6 bacterium RIFCSPHIGHO2_12_FULL_32_22]|nr:MAG: hypothetical protein A3F66_02640 [candidate division TM6 bacterium RIFCSPHIGHO2_12_FULL_32_22]
MKKISILAIFGLIFSNNFAMHGGLSAPAAIPQAQLSAKVQDLLKNFLAEKSDLNTTVRELSQYTKHDAPLGRQLTSLKENFGNLTRIKENPSRVDKLIKLFEGFFDFFNIKIGEKKAFKLVIDNYNNIANIATLGKEPKALITETESEKLYNDIQALKNRPITTNAPDMQTAIDSVRKFLTAENLDKDTINNFISQIKRGQLKKGFGELLEIQREINNLRNNLTDFINLTEHLKRVGVLLESVRPDDRGTAAKMLAEEKIKAVLSFSDTIKSIENIITVHNKLNPEDPITDPVGAATELALKYRDYIRKRIIITDPVTIKPPIERETPPAKPIVEPAGPATTAPTEQPTEPRIFEPAEEI